MNDATNTKTAQSILSVCRASKGGARYSDLFRCAAHQGDLAYTLHVLVDAGLVLRTGDEWTRRFVAA